MCSCCDGGSAAQKREVIVCWTNAGSAQPRSAEQHAAATRLSREMRGAAQKPKHFRFPMGSLETSKVKTLPFMSVSVSVHPSSGQPCTTTTSNRFCQHFLLPRNGLIARTALCLVLYPSSLLLCNCSRATTVRLSRYPSSLLPYKGLNC